MHKPVHKAHCVFSCSVFVNVIDIDTSSTTCHHRGYNAIDTCIDSTSVWQISIAKAAHRVFQSVKQSEEFSSILSVLCACCVFKCSCSRGPKCCDSDPLRLTQAPRSRDSFFPSDFMNLSFYRLNSVVCSGT